MTTSHGDIVTELAAAIHALDEAPSLAGVLQALVQCAGRHADGVTVFLVKEGRLREWRPDAGRLRSSGADGDAMPTATFPVIVGGRVVAILRAEVVHQPAILDVLTCHASRVLESMTLHKALGLVPPRHAIAERDGGGSLR